VQVAKYISYLKKTMCKRVPDSLSLWQLADSRGYLLDDEGFDYGKLALLRNIKIHNKSLR
jgi:hypothetical protein